MSQKRRFALALFATFLLGLGVGYGVRLQDELLPTVAIKKIHPLDVSRYRFTKPLIAVELQTLPMDLSKKDVLQELLEHYISKRQRASGIDAISAYFRSLDKGRWAGVNEEEKFHPASLFKVPLMIAFLKKAETEPGILQKRLHFGPLGDQEVRDYFEGQTTRLKPGETYTVEALLREMIIASDNVAKNLLYRLIVQHHFELNDSIWNEVYKDSSIPPPRNLDELYEISPKAYSLFFRGLYNATLLNPDLSEKGLLWLSEATFNKGLTAGVSDTITVAHKFGYHLNPKSGHIELHDCGIFYAFDYPYFLCVMTKGTNRSLMENTIQEISNLVFNQRKKEYGRPLENTAMPVRFGGA